MRQDDTVGYEHDKANRMTKLADQTQTYDLAGNGSGVCSECGAACK